MLAAFAVALMAGFTGLSLTRGAAELSASQRKVSVAMAAVALGGGIWSMHFVAMLGMRLPILFYYDVLITMISALLAILVVGLALLILHFRRRTAGAIAAAGALVGLGICVMHFVGMLGMRICGPVNQPVDYLVTALLAVPLSVFAIWIAYGERRNRNTLLGTVSFALAVVAVHYIAMAQTDFVQTASAPGAAPSLSNDAMAIGVTIAAFLICGAFLLSGVNYFEQRTTDGAPATAPSPETDAPPRGVGAPYQRDGRTHFVPCADIAAVRAEGHYTVLYAGAEKLFCPWSISEAEERMTASGFLRAHRSYLVNPAHVTGFERLKDTGIIYFEGVDSLPKAPVSRSRLTEVREALGL